MRRSERSDVPFATDALQHDQRKRKDRRTGGPSEIRSGVLDQAIAAAPFRRGARQMVAMRKSYFTFSHANVTTLIFPSLGNGAGRVV